MIIILTFGGILLLLFKIFLLILIGGSLNALEESKTFKHLFYEKEFNWWQCLLIVIGFILTVIMLPIISTFIINLISAINWSNVVIAICICLLIGAFTSHFQVK